MREALGSTSRQEPKHARVRRKIEEQVVATLQPGDYLLSERRLEAEFGVSRITIRRAIADLVQDGVLVRIERKGTFVPQASVHTTLCLSSFDEGGRMAGVESSSQVIKAALVQPAPDIACQLSLKPEEHAYLVERLNLADDRPVCVEQSWIRSSVPTSTGAEDLITPLLGATALVDTGSVRRVEQTVQATAVPERYAPLLNIAHGSPVLVVRRRLFSGEQSSGVPSAYSVLTYRSDRYRPRMRFTPV